MLPKAYASAGAGFAAFLAAGFLAVDFLVAGFLAAFGLVVVFLAVVAFLVVAVFLAAGFFAEAFFVAVFFGPGVFLVAAFFGAVVFLVVGFFVFLASAAGAAASVAPCTRLHLVQNLSQTYFTMTQNKDSAAWKTFGHQMTDSALDLKQGAGQGVKD